MEYATKEFLDGIEAKAQMRKSEIRNTDDGIHIEGIKELFGDKSAKYYRKIIFSLRQGLH